MTLKTICVRTEAGGNGHRDAIAGWLVTCGARHAAHVQVPRVIELHVEGRESWKRFQRPCGGVCVADGAHRTGAISELFRVTAGAG